MADRNVRVTLALVASGFEAGMARAKASTDSLTKSLDASAHSTTDMSTQAQKAAATAAAGAAEVRSAWDKAGTAMVAAGTAAVVGVGLVTKAAMDWESAWAGVLKTVDGTDEQLAGLESSLREMARTMPATHAEIAAVAEAAGQLGVATGDVSEFTRVMIMLGETTNLSADQAATSLAQFMNIMGSAPSMVGNLGSALVELGNNGASTEADILALATRVASAGKSVGMAEADVLGFAAAMANVGIEAEAGGTAISMTFQQIDKAVRQGGAALEQIAQISGVSADQFATAWGKDAAGAAELFILGLGDMQARGESAKGALDELGMSGIRQADTLVRLALSGDKFSESLQMSDSAIQSTSALLEEYGKRAATTESQVQVAWNAIKDAAITAGAVMLPVVAGIAEAVAGMATLFSSLPGPVTAALTVITGIGGAGLLAVGGVMKLTTTVMDLKSTVSILSDAFPGLTSRMKGVGWAGAISGAVALTAALVIMHQASEESRRQFDALIVGADDLGATLLRTADAGKSLDEIFTLETRGVFSGVTKEVDGLGDALSRVMSPSGGQGFEDFWNGLASGLLGTRSASEQMTKQFGELDASLANMTRGGNLAGAAKLFEEVAAAAEAQGIPIEDLATLFPQYADALRTAAGASGEAKLGSELLADGLGSVADEGNAALDAVIKLGNQMLALSGSQIGFEAAVDSAAEAIKEYGQAAMDSSGNIDISTESGRQLQSSLDTIAASALTVIERMIAAGASTEEIASFQQRAAVEFLNTASAMGLSSETAAQLAADYGVIPTSVATAISTPGAELSHEQTANLTAALMAVPELTNAQVLAPGARPSKDEVDAFIASIGAVPGLTEAQIRTVADLLGVQQAKAAIATVQDKTVRVAVIYTASGNRSTAGGIFADGGMLSQHGGQLVQAFAGGGFASTIGAQQPQIRPAGGAGILWSEEGAGPWEAFISGHPAKRGRSRWLLEETARRLGGLVNWATPFADGGMVHYGPSSSPRDVMGAPSPGASAALDPAALAAAVRDAITGIPIRLERVSVIGDYIEASIMAGYEGSY